MIIDDAIQVPYVASKKLRADGYPDNWALISMRVKNESGWRCVRCGHRAEAPGPGRRVPCTSSCDIDRHPESVDFPEVASVYRMKAELAEVEIELGLWPMQRQRLLTVHHLDGDKTNCLWWNLIATCQACHLSVQARVKMPQNYMFEHSDWFKPYVAGYYAFSRLNETLTREQVMLRLDELLALGIPTAKQG